MTLGNKGQGTLRGEVGTDGGTATRSILSLFYFIGIAKGWPGRPRVGRTRENQLWVLKRNLSTVFETGVSICLL